MRRRVLVLLVVLATAPLPGCLFGGPSLAIEGFEAEETVVSDGQLNVTVTVTNRGVSSVDTVAVFEMSGLRREREVLVGPGNTRTVRFSVDATLDPGTYSATMEVVPVVDKPVERVRVLAD